MAFSMYRDEFESPHCLAWLRGEPLPALDAETEEWREYLRESTQSGKRWRRVHLLRQPLTDYLRYELWGYQETQRLGWEALIVDLDAHPELNAYDQDWYLLDGDEPDACAVLMRYDDEGRFRGMWRTGDPLVLAECRRQRDAVLSAAVPLADFLDRDLVQPKSVRMG